LLHHPTPAHPPAEELDLPDLPEELPDHPLELDHPLPDLPDLPDELPDHPPQVSCDAESDHVPLPDFPDLPEELPPAQALLDDQPPSFSMRPRSLFFICCCVLLSSVAVATAASITAAAITALTFAMVCMCIRSVDRFDYIEKKRYNDQTTTVRFAQQKIYLHSLPRDVIE
jgi:hypothetical protein